VIEPAKHPATAPEAKLVNTESVPSSENLFFNSWKNVNFKLA